MGEDLTDKEIEFIKDAKVIAPDKPFFPYYAPGGGGAHRPPQLSAGQQLGVDRRDLR